MSADELPEGWVWTAITEVTEPVPNYKPESEPNREFGYVDISSICNETHQILDHKRFRGTDAPSRARRPIRLGDVLFSNVRTYLRNIAIIPSSLNAQLCSTGFTVLRSNGAIDPHFLFRYVLTDHFIDRVTPQQTGTHYPATSDRVVMGEYLPLPPLAEQRRIVAKVEALLARVNAARQRLADVPAILKRFRQSVLAAACSGRLTADWREEDRSNESDLPAGWEMAPVSTIATLQNGRAFPSKQYDKRGVKLLRPGNLHISGEVSWTEKNTKCLPIEWAERFPEYLLKTGDLLMNLTAQSLKDEFLGRVCLNPDSSPALLNQRICRFMPRASDVRPYLFVYFKSPLFRAYVNTLDTGSLIRHMHSKQVVNHELPLPPLAEQHEIVRRVEALFRLAEAIEKRVAAATARAERLTQAILAKAFRGELVPTEAELARREGRDYEPASVLVERIRAERASAGIGKTRKPRRERAEGR